MDHPDIWMRLLEQYGYWVVLVGTFLEGETVLLVAAALAHKGFFSPALLALCAFAGTLASDEIMFFVGRYYGRPFLEKRPGLVKASVRILRLLDRYETLFLIGFRFFYGLRNATPLVMGAHGVRPARFIVCNLIGAALWSVTFTALGYGVGAMIWQVAKHWL